MIIGKRQFLLAALVLILALAVYLNWRLSNGGSQNVTDVYAGGTLGQAVLVDLDSAAEQDYFAKSKADREEAVETAERAQNKYPRVSRRIIRHKKQASKW